MYQNINCKLNYYQNVNMKISVEQERLETSPSYKTWIEEQERIENEREIEEKRQSLIRYVK